jgi:hypothetical protein
MFVLGALPGAINVLGWQALNTWCALVQGQFKANHPSCHSIADMGQLVGGRVVKEITGVLFLVAFIIVGASGMVGVSTALNALSEHSLCTNYFSIIAALMVGLCASVRRFEKLTWITWAGFASVFIAVFIVVYVLPPIPPSPPPPYLTHLQRRRHHPRPPSRRPSNRALRLRLPHNRPPDLRRGHHRRKHNLLLRRRHLRLPPRHVRDAPAAGVLESRVRVHGHRHRRLPLLLPRRV